MCVFSVQKELEDRELTTTTETTDKKHKRLPRTKLSLEGDEQYCRSQNKQDTQNRTEITIINTQQFKGQGVF